MAIKYLDTKVFCDDGYLQEVNRRFFHPCGLALEVTEYFEDDSPEHHEELEKDYKKRADELQEKLPNVPREHLEAVVRELNPPGTQYISGVWDYRDDPEGITFGFNDSSDPEWNAIGLKKANVVEAQRAKMFPTRRAALGFMTEPIDGFDPPYYPFYMDEHTNLLRKTT